MDDPLRSTLQVLPLVWAGLWALGRRLRGQDGHVTSPLVSGLEAAMLGVLVLAILGRRHLGLAAGSPGGEQLLVAGLVVLLVSHGAVLLHRIVAAGGPHSRGTRDALFLALPLIVYLAVLPWTRAQRPPDGDEPYYLLIAHSIAYDLDTELTDNYARQDSLQFMPRALEPEWADPVRPDGRRFSRHSPVLPLLLAPAYRLMGPSGAFGMMAVLSALVAWLSLRLAQCHWPGKGVELTLTWALLSFTPPLLIYSHQVWVEVPAALLLLVGLLHIHRLREAGGSERYRWWVLAVVLVLLPLLKLRFALLSGSLLVLAWWRTGRSRRLGLMLGAVLLAGLTGMLIFNQMAYDRPFKDHTLEQLLRIQGRSPGLYLVGLMGLFWDCAFGLFASNPLWLLLIPGLLLVGWRRSPLLAEVMICCVPYLALVSPRREWYGAWAPPFRFGVVLLPLLALTLVPLFVGRRRSGAQLVALTLTALALSLTLLWIVQPGWTYNLAVGSNHLLDHLAMRWDADVGRFLPSFVRIRLASWLVPMLVAPAVVLLWWYPRRHAAMGIGWACALLLLGTASLPLAATRIPTRWVEVEDRQVEKRGGELYPDSWVVYRPRYRGGWRLGPGDSVRVPVVSGGTRAAMRLELQTGGLRGDASMTLELLAGDRVLARRPLNGGPGWQILAVGEQAWPAGASLLIRIAADPRVSASPWVILDRLRFDWS